MSPPLPLPKVAAAVRTADWNCRYAGRLPPPVCLRGRKPAHLWNPSLAPRSLSTCPPGARGQPPSLRSLFPGPLRLQCGPVRSAPARSSRLSWGPGPSCSPSSAPPRCLISVPSSPAAGNPRGSGRRPGPETQGLEEAGGGDPAGREAGRATDGCRGLGPFPRLLQGLRSRAALRHQPRRPTPPVRPAPEPCRLGPPLSQQTLVDTGPSRLTARPYLLGCGGSKSAPGGLQGEGTETPLLPGPQILRPQPPAPLLG